jgi:AcrR family transcriptional regulator
VSDTRAMDGEAAAEARPLAPALAQPLQSVSYNLNGQRLGRKGRETRERIVRAAIEVLGEEGEEPFTLSAVARQASLGMSSLYNYFTDLSELMEAALEPVMTSASETYLTELGSYWPDAEISERCEQFWQSYTDFWRQNAPVLLQRNRMSDAGDERMLACRVRAGMPLMDGIASQLCRDKGAVPNEKERAVSSVLGTMMERTVTVQSQPNYRNYTAGSFERGMSALGLAGSWLVALAIREWRETGAHQG